MPLISATNLSQSFGPSDVFAGISVSIAEGARIGLVGPNGVGKTSLIRILAGAEKAAAGDLSVTRGVRVGYLRQEAIDAFANREANVWDEMLTVFADLRQSEARLRELEEAMTNHGPQADAALEEYGTLHDDFMAAGGYDYERRIKNTLEGLGFTEELWSLPARALSGGQKTRALLARLLLERPELLILDEPTNHLDIASLEWLEGTLAEWPGAFVVVSHDRYFLNKVVNRIWEMSPSRIEEYRGNYTDYLGQREERYQREVFVFNQEKARLENEVRLAKIDLDAVKAGNDKSVTWAKGKLKRVTRDALVIEQLGALALLNEQWMLLRERLEGSSRPWGLEEAERRVSRLRPPQPPARMTLTLQAERRSGNSVLSGEGLVVGYPGTPLFAADDFELRWRERAALIGPNGAGKTTFLRVALGDLEPLAGRLTLGASIKVGYFAQAHELLNPAMTVLEQAIERSHESGQRKLDEGQARYYLAKYLFKGEDVYKPVAGLSGGERARLALALLALTGANFLVLDEPTNHLDTVAQEALQEALESYDGTVLLVSHDRYLIRSLARQIWTIEDGRMRVFNGGYDEYTQTRDRRAAALKAAAPKPTPKPAVALEPAAQARPSNNARRARADQLGQIEARIGAAERDLAALAERLQREPARARELGENYVRAQQGLDQLMQEWAALSTALTALEGV
ncbi:MAG TPA: ABC-F family ATP-binding cassette domain-containing protein [Thermoflexales bacterium]|nr:ABC-F family ATP-binding cassette domain-containing protein [Thermoflexales bacterium]